MFMLLASNMLEKEDFSRITPHDGRKRVTERRRSMTQFMIRHELAGRMRLRPLEGTRDKQTELMFRDHLLQLSTVQNVAYSSITGSLLIHFEKTVGAQEHIQDELAIWNRAQAEDVVLQTEHSASPQAIFVSTAALVVHFLVPLPWRPLLLVPSCWPYWIKGLSSLARGKIDSAVLDASAITASFLIKDYFAAGVIPLLLNIGNYLEDRIRADSNQDIAAAMHMQAGHAWVLVSGREQQKPLADLIPGDQVVARADTAISVDGTVIQGFGLVNEARLTGESLAIEKKTGDRVLATSILMEGELLILAESTARESRASQIQRMVREVTLRKGPQESLALRLADQLAWPIIGLSAATYLWTGSIQRAVAVLLVDFSCALKLSTPLIMNCAIASGLRQGIYIKGSRAIEALSKANAFVLDKTGTVTFAQPSVAEVKAFHGHDEAFVLKTAACLEEHFPHPTGKAIVQEAERQHLEHEEEHGKVHYRIARGIESSWHGQVLRIGSQRFMEESGIALSKWLRRRDNGSKHRLYLTLDREVIGMIDLEDKLRPDARELVRSLKARGIKRIDLLTGDRSEPAQRIARGLDVSEVVAEALPDDKLHHIKSIREQGYVVCMVGDGINDAPALRSADVGIALEESAELAKAGADIVVLDNQLSSIPFARDTAVFAMHRVRTNLAAIVAINSSLILGSALGILPPTAAAAFHNFTSLAMALNAIRPFPARQDADNVDLENDKEKQLADLYKSHPAEVEDQGVLNPLARIPNY
jgi:heavy metal translocating P-type ATPase